MPKTAVKKVAAALLFLSIASADPVADHYRKLLGTSLITADNPYLQSGWYRLGSRETGDRPDLSNANFTGGYHFGQAGETWQPFLTGGFGFNKISQDHVTLGSGDLGNVTLDSSYLTLGAGIDYHPTEHLILTLGANGLWMHSDGDYTGSDPSMQSYFGSGSDAALYEFFGSANYHLRVEGYKPYAQVTLRRLTIDYDFDLPSAEGWEADLTLGTYTPTLTTWMDLPVRAHLYMAATLLDDELSDLTGFGHAYHAGASLLWKVGPMIHLFDDAFKETELSVTLQGTKGDGDLSGWKAGIGFTITRF